MNALPPHGVGQVPPLGLVVAAPLRGPSGARLRPLLAALAASADVRFLAAMPSELDLAPGAAIAMPDWLDDPGLDGVPHLHILSDDAASAHVLRAALLRPGLTLLDDPGLSRLYQSISLDSGQPEAWLRLLAQHHGAVGRRLGRAQLAGLFAPGQRHRMPMLDAVAEAAPMLVVRSRHALSFLPPGARAVVLSPHAPAPARADHAQGRVLVLPLGEPPSARALAPLHEAAAAADAELRLWLPGDDAALDGATAALALSLPFGATPLHALARAMACGLPVLAWSEDPAAEWPQPAVTPIAFPAGPPALAEAMRRLLDEAATRGAAARLHAAAHGPHAAARALLALVPGCRVRQAAP